MLGIYDSVIKVVSAIVAALVQLLLVIMVVIIFWMVISRQLLSRAPSWVEEISLVMIIWFGLIGATFGVRDRYHLRMDLFFRENLQRENFHHLLPSRAKTLLERDVNLIGLAIFLAFKGRIQSSDDHPLPDDNQ